MCWAEVLPAVYLAALCRPYGLLKLSIKATWIQNASPDPDAMTDVSFMSSIGHQSMTSSAVGASSIDQVLMVFGY